MHPCLVVRLPADDAAPLRWVAVDARGRAEASSISAGDDSLAQSAHGREIIALVDATAVLLTRARVPTRNSARLAQAVPYSLEDYLSSEIDSLHFALGRRGAEGDLSVAVVGRARMEGWLTRLREAGIEPSRMLPEPLALPRTPDTWTLLVDAERFMVRTAESSGFAGDRDNLSALLEAALGEAEARPPQGIAVAYTGTEQPLLPASAPEAYYEVCADATALLAEGVAGVTLDLRQGAFARRQRRLAHWRRWRAPAALVLAAVLLASAGAWIERLSLAAQSRHLETRMAEVFRSAFPNSQVPAGQEVSVMRARLERLRGGGSAGGMLGLLGHIAAPIGATQGVELTALNYRNRVLEIELGAASLQQVEQLKQRLQGKDVRVEVRSARSEGDRVRGRLRLEASR